MKNTKNVLLAGVALAMTLFASVQITAMTGKRVNPYLSNQNKAAILDAINNWQNDLDPKNPNYKHMTPEDIEVARATIKGYSEVYYGNKAYTPVEAHQLINSYVIPVRDKYRNAERQALRNR